jgi:hypothetical protein
MGLPTTTTALKGRNVSELRRKYLKVENRQGVAAAEYTAAGDSWQAVHLQLPSGDHTRILEGHQST